MLLISGGIDELGLGSHHRYSGNDDASSSWTRLFDEFLKMIMKQILDKDSKHELVKALQVLDDDEIFYNILSYIAKEFGDDLIQTTD